MRKRTERIKIASVSVALLLTAFVSADEFQVGVKPPAAGIAGVSFDQAPVDVQVDRSGPKPRGFIVITGRAEKGTNALLMNDQEVEVSPSGAFSKTIYLGDGATQRITLRSVDNRGEIKSESVTLDFPRSVDFRKRMDEIAFERKDFVAVNGGLSYVSYQQTGIASLSQESFVLRGSYTRVLTERLSANASAFFSFPLHSSLSGTSLQFYGIDGRFGFSPSWPQTPWKLTLFGGVYYVTVPNSNAFGYTLSGPQLYPVVERTFASGNRVSGYFKFSPLGNNFSIGPLSNREIATGAEYSYRMKAGHPLRYNFDFAQLSFSSNNSSVSQNTYALSAGYGF